MSRQDDLQKQIAEHQRRLQKLKEREARQGISTPPEVLIEIEDIETKLEELQAHLAELKEKYDESPQSKTASPPAEPNPEPAGFRARPQIFLCHASEDKPQVQELYRKLKDAGYRPWLDKFDLLPGQDWEFEIRRVIRESDFFLACLSNNSTDKRGYVQKEIKIGLDTLDQMPEGAIYLIPVRLEECEVPERLRSRHWVDLFEPDGFEYLTRALDYEIKNRRSEPKPASGAPPKAYSSRPSLPEPAPVEHPQMPSPQPSSEPESFYQNLLRLSRDPIWQMFGVLVAIIGVIWAVYTFYAGGNILDLTAAEPTPLSTEPSDPSLTTQTDLNVWAGPDLDFDLLGLLPTGTTADIIGRSEDGQWWQIRFDPAVDNVGWVVSDPIFSTASSVGNVPVVPAPATPTPKPSPTPTSMPSPTNSPEPTPTPTVEILLEDNFDSENGGQGTTNYADFTHWDVVEGSVDLVGNGYYDFFRGNGLYIDLDGSTHNAGILESKNTFLLTPGEYELQFRIAGSKMSISKLDVVNVELGTVFSNTFVRDFNDPFTVIRQNICISSPTSGKLRYEHFGGDQEGIKLDDVKLSKISDSQGSC